MIEKLDSTISYNDYLAFGYLDSDFVTIFSQAVDHHQV